jgi:hypothetical protein
MLCKAYCEERRSLRYNNGRTKSKLSMASRDFTILINMELDDLDNEFIKDNIKWISLLHLMKNIDLYKEAICKTSSI